MSLFLSRRWLGPRSAGGGSWRQRIEGWAAAATGRPYAVWFQSSRATKSAEGRQAEVVETVVAFTGEDRG
jgi:hypothetical protein